MGTLTREQKQRKFIDIAKHAYVEKSKRMVRAMQWEPFGWSTWDQIRWHLGEVVRSLDEWEGALKGSIEPDPEEEEVETEDLGNPVLL